MIFFYARALKKLEKGKDCGPDNISGEVPHTVNVSAPARGFSDHSKLKTPVFV